MTSTQLNLIAPLATPLPPPSKGEVLTESQWTTLMAIADTVIPSIEVSSDFSRASLSLPASEYSTAIEKIESRLPSTTDAGVPQQYLRESASSISGFQVQLRRQLADYVPQNARRAIGVILSALE